MAKKKIVDRIALLRTLKTVYAFDTKISSILWDGQNVALMEKKPEIRLNGYHNLQVNLTSKLSAQFAGLKAADFSGLQRVNPNLYVSLARSRGIHCSESPRMVKVSHNPLNSTSEVSLRLGIHAAGANDPIVRINLLRFSIAQEILDTGIVRLKMKW